MKVLVYDVEADNLLLDATTIYCIVTQDIQTGEVREFTPDNMDQAFDHLCSADRLIGHNCRMFDDPVVEKLLGNGRKLPPSYDTILMSRLLYPDRQSNPVGGHSLEAWGKYLGSNKLEFHDFSAFSQEMLTYCRQDVALTAKIYQHLLPKVKPFASAMSLEHEVASIISRQIQNGVEFFPDVAEDLKTKIELLRYDALQELVRMVKPWFKITWLKTPHYYYDPDTMQGYRRKADAPAKIRPLLRDGPLRYKLTVTEFNPGSGDHIAKHFMERRGWKPTKFTDSGKPATDERVVDELARKFPEAELLNKIRMYDKRLSQIAQWFDYNRDGRVHGSVITLGTVTSRMSHSEPNMAQVPKVGKPFGEECRSSFGPRDGWAQVGCDASGLQARMLAHYMAQYDNGAYAEVILNGDIHTHNQEMAGLPTRDNAKTFFYGYLFGAGDAKIGTITGKGPAEGKRLKARFRESLPALARLEQVLKSQAARGHIVGLDGRHIPIRQDYRALNSLLMSGEAIVMKRALSLFYKNAVSLYGPHGGRWALLLAIHDEQQFECEPEIAESIGQLFADSITAAGEHYNLRIRLDGEYKVGRNWCECH